MIYNGHWIYTTLSVITGYLPRPPLEGRDLQSDRVPYYTKLWKLLLFIKLWFPILIPIHFDLFRYKIILERKFDLNTFQFQMSIQM